jgi:hypothetical protein
MVEGAQYTYHNMKMNVLDWIAFVLVIIGGLNWGLVGALNYNVVYTIFGIGTVADVVYILVGLSALYLLATSSKMTKKSGMPSGQM